MKMTLSGDLIEHEDGSATARLDVDEEAKLYLMQLGFEVLLMRNLDVAEKETNVAEKETNGCKENL